MATQNRVRKEMQIVARWLAGAITAGFIAAGSAGCGDSPTAPKPPGPAPTPSPAPTPLTLTAVSPSTGPAGGGTPVTLTGDGFVSGATVMIGGVSSVSHRLHEHFDDGIHWGARGGCRRSRGDEPRWPQRVAGRGVHLCP